MPKLRDEVDRIAALAVVFLALIFHFLLSVIVTERYVEHSGIILFVTLVCGWTVLGWIGSLICTILGERRWENIKDAH
jgi:hypothetical protein